MNVNSSVLWRATPCTLVTRKLTTNIQYNFTYPDAGYPDRLGLSGKFVENSTKLTCLEITGTVQYCIMASRTSDQTCSKGLDEGTHCK